jgi:hypothetical protein
MARLIEIGNNLLEKIKKVFAAPFQAFICPLIEQMSF